MNCPICSYPNPQGVTYCQMCYEVFNRSAADRYLHAQKRARRERDASKGISPESSPPASDSNGSGSLPSSSVHHARPTTPPIVWGDLFKRFFNALSNSAQTMTQWVRDYPKEIGLALGIITLGVLTLFYTSPLQRLKLFGTRLGYHFPLKTKVGYLVGIHTEAKSWSERDGRLDTPLATTLKDEMGTLTLKASSFKVDLQASPFHQETQKVDVHAQEWIMNEVGGVSESIPLNHPSLKTTRAVLDRSGIVLSRDNNFSTRIGRSATFLLSRWPPGTHRRGQSWEEPIGWVSVLGEWKVFWRGKLRWVLTDYESRDGSTYLHLHYKADVVPGLWDTPSWTQGGLHAIKFNGTSEGDVLFDNSRHQVLSHVFNQEGTLTIPIDNIYLIPMEQRVGRLPRHGWFHNVDPEPGKIFVQFSDKMDIRLR